MRFLRIAAALTASLILPATLTGLAFGVASAQSSATEISLVETVGVSDLFVVEPPQVIPVVETIVAGDTAALQPPTIIGQIEGVTLTDSPTLQPPHVIDLVEHGVVTDSPHLALPHFINIIERAILTDSVIATPMGLIPVPAVGFAAMAVLSAALSALIFFRTRRSTVNPAPKM